LHSRHQLLIVDAALPGLSLRAVAFSAGGDGGSGLLALAHAAITAAADGTASCAPFV